MTGAHRQPPMAPERHQLTVAAHCGAPNLIWAIHPPGIAVSSGTAMPTTATIRGLGSTDRPGSGYLSQPRTVQAFAVTSIRLTALMATAQISASCVLRLVASIPAS